MIAIKLILLGLFLYWPFSVFWLIQEEAQKSKFYNSHCYKLQNQKSRPIFDGLTQNFVIGSKN
jgi:hypothetical protein